LEGCWRWSANAMEKAIADGRVEFIKKDKEWIPYEKIFAPLEGEEATKKYTTWIDDVGNGTPEIKALFGTPPFDYAKSTDLIKHFIKMAGVENDDIILDFFSGSGTTAHAVMQLNAEDGGNRRFILVQLPEVTDEKSEAFKAGYKNICEIGKERIRRAGRQILELSLKSLEKEGVIVSDGELSEVGSLENGDEFVRRNQQNDLSPDQKTKLSVLSSDLGFKVFKLDSSNLKLWDGIPTGVGNGAAYFAKVRNVIDGVKEDRPAVDVVYELMLKLGVPLTEQIVEKQILDKTVYSVGGDLLLFCLEYGVTAEFVEALADLSPAKIILAEQGFADDTAMANAHYILQDHGIEMKLV